jgi:transketolase
MSLTETEITDLGGHGREIRRLVIDAIAHVGTGHAGSSLSMIEILVYLYFHYLSVDPRLPERRDRDRLILSKGHGAPGLYAVLARRGYFPVEELRTLRQLGSRLQGHPTAGALPGIDASTGSLGQGLSIASGLAHGLRLQGIGAQVVCILGDGELQEGQNWEAFLAASRFGLGNLLAIVDRNALQNDGPTEAIMPLDPIVAKGEAFGWRTIEINGHDYEELDAAIAPSRRSEQPTLIVAQTVKGKGVSFMEGQVKWHHHPISPDERSIALSEIERQAAP